MSDPVAEGLFRFGTAQSLERNAGSAKVLVTGAAFQSLERNAGSVKNAPLNRVGTEHVLPRRGRNGDNSKAAAYECRKEQYCENFSLRHNSQFVVSRLNIFCRDTCPYPEATRCLKT